MIERQRLPETRFVLLWKYDPETDKTLIVYQTIQKFVVKEHGVREVRGPIMGRGGGVEYAHSAQ